MTETVDVKREEQDDGYGGDQSGRAVRNKNLGMDVTRDFEMAAQDPLGSNGPGTVTYPLPFFQATGATSHRYRDKGNATDVLLIVAVVGVVVYEDVGVTMSELRLPRRLPKNSRENVLRIE
ncbi:hypothetical protein C8F04DRAFT_1193123 [Mycena alexandri]|uniref:Uncharacterized protein n=1 Tax=Mycena alexandri TaxID=1745969 RepID=A0AAD6SBV7_9AGAR|nr:hypothetical protein C8F04DRAFT_1193123 [Mycena alexandri]